MLPPRQVVIARTSAGAFALAAGLSLLNETTEWTAAFRGLFAALATVCIVPILYNFLERALDTTINAPPEAPPASVNITKTGGKVQ